MPAKLNKLATRAVTAATIHEMPLDMQISAVEQSLRTRADAEARVKKHRLNCVDILHKFGVDLHGKPLQPEQLEEVLSEIVIYKPAAKVDELVKSIATQSGYDVRALVKNVDEAALVKAFGKKGFDFLVKVNEFGRGVVNEVDQKATEKARKEFTTEFTAFRAALTEYEASKGAIDNINEYLGIVEKISNIGNNKTKGTRS